MEGIFRGILAKEVERQGGTEHIELVERGDVDVYIKVPPAHLMGIRAEKNVRAWLRGAHERAGSKSR